MADQDPIRPRVIWLSPCCEGCDRYLSYEDGQKWCSDPQDDCPECGLGWTRYVIDEEQAAEMRAEYQRALEESDHA
jgi:hypothetical protein